MALRLSLWYLLPHIVAVVFGQQIKIQFEIPQATTLWSNPEILGNSTMFLHPVSMGTVSPCDVVEVARVFSESYALLSNYTSAGRNAYNDPSVRLQSNAGYRQLSPNRTIDKRVLTAGGCLMACITEEEFFCREVDYFERDGGKCALYATEGFIYAQAKDVPGNTANPRYVGDLTASDHYTLYKSGETQERCDLVADYNYLTIHVVDSTKMAYNYFALGWKSMESGWYSLARMMFKNATQLDPTYHMAYVGEMLSNENMGYGLANEDGSDFKDLMDNIIQSDDFEVRLSLQEQLLVKALFAMQSGASLEEGLKDMNEVFISNTATLKDSIINVVEGNGNLLSLGTFEILKQMGDNEGNVYALQLLLHNLNPYENGKNRTSAREQAGATDALYDYAPLNIKGAWPMTFDSSDIAEYYSVWNQGRNLLFNFKEFVALNYREDTPDKLLGSRGNNLIVNGLDVDYVSRSVERIYIYERLQFFNIQLALFKVAEADFNDFNISRISAPGTAAHRELEAIRFRMIANSYFSVYDYIYQSYADKLPLEDEDWNQPILESDDDLTLASRAYYWAAAGSHRILETKQSIAEIKSAFEEAKNVVKLSSYKTLIEIYETVVKGTEERIKGQYDAAFKSAQSAGDMQDGLIDADFAIEGNDASAAFRLLIPLGFQFRADTYWSLFKIEAAKETLGTSMDIDTVVEAYRVTVNTPPLNTSRILMGFGESLLVQGKDLPRMEDSDDPDYVLAFKAFQRAWENEQTDVGAATLLRAETAVEEWYDKPVSGCGADFQIISKGDNKLCWGGFIIIGVAVAFVVIIAIVVGILCLRKKAAETATRKKKDEKNGFMFSGPVGLSRQDSYASSYQMGMSSLARNANSPAYASQTLSIQRPFMDDNDYAMRSNTLGGKARRGEEEFEVSTSH